MKSYGSSRHPKRKKSTSFLIPKHITFGKTQLSLNVHFRTLNWSSFLYTGAWTYDLLWINKKQKAWHIVIRKKKSKQKDQGHEKVVCLVKVRPNAQEKWKKKRKFKRKLKIKKGHDKAKPRSWEIIDHNKWEWAKEKVS